MPSTTLSRTMWELSDFYPTNDARMPPNASQHPVADGFSLCPQPRHFSVPGFELRPFRPVSNVPRPLLWYIRLATIRIYGINTVHTSRKR